MKPLLLIGGGGHCLACIDVIESNSGFSVAGIVERDAESAKALLSYPVLGTDNELDKLLKFNPAALITVGQIKSPANRIRIFTRLKNLGAEMPCVVSSKAYISRYAQLAAGTIIMHSAVVNASASIGENCIINSQALIEHGSIIEAHCHISTGVKLNGDVHIESGCFVGSGTVVREGVHIGANSIIQAGSIILHDVTAGTHFRRGR